MKNKSLFDLIEETSRELNRKITKDPYSRTLTGHLADEGIPAVVTHAGLGAAIGGVIGGKKGAKIGATFGLVFDVLHKEHKKSRRDVRRRI